LICLKSSSWLTEHRLPCEVFYLDYHGMLKWDFVICLKRLVSLIQQKNIHILQTFFEDSLFIGCFAVMASRHKPALIASRRDLGLGSSEPWYHMLFRGLFPLAIRRFNGIVVNAEAIRSHLQNRSRIPAERIRVIPNGLEIPVAKPDPLPSFRAHLGAFWVGVVANLRPVKRLDVFLQGFAFAVTRCPGTDLRAVILGRGEELNNLLALARTLGISARVHFAGSVENVGDYLTHLDVGVLCSDREGLSNAVIEYMAYELPVVATAVGRTESASLLGNPRPSERL
jgi:glycosyltransferase involved in cell wall biosynthesis